MLNTIWSGPLQVNQYRTQTYPCESPFNSTDANIKPCHYIHYNETTALTENITNTCNCPVFGN